MDRPGLPRASSDRERPRRGRRGGCRDGQVTPGAGHRFGSTPERRAWVPGARDVSPSSGDLMRSVGALRWVPGLRRLEGFRRARDWLGGPPTARRPELGGRALASSETRGRTVRERSRGRPTSLQHDERTKSLVPSTAVGRLSLGANGEARTHGPAETQPRWFVRDPRYTSAGPPSRHGLCHYPPPKHWHATRVCSDRGRSSPGGGVVFPRGTTCPGSAGRQKRLESPSSRPRLRRDRFRSVSRRTSSRIPYRPADPPAARRGLGAATALAYRGLGVLVATGGPTHGAFKRSLARPLAFAHARLTLPKPEDVSWHLG